MDTVIVEANSLMAFLPLLNLLAAHPYVHNWQIAIGDTPYVMTFCWNGGSNLKGSRDRYFERTVQAVPQDGGETLYQFNIGDKLSAWDTFMGLLNPPDYI